MLTWFRHGLSLLLAGFFLWLALRGEDLDQLTSALASASPVLLLMGGTLTLAVSGVHATRIMVLMQPEHQLRFGSVFTAELVSILVDIIFPLRLHELVRAFIIGRSEGLPASRLLGVQVVEKAVELPLLVGLMLSLWLARPLPDWTLPTIYAGLGAVALVGVLMGLVITRPTLLERPVQWIGQLDLPGAEFTARVLSELLAGMRLASSSPGRFFGVLLITIAEWALLSLALWLAVASIDVHLSPGELLGLLIASHVAFAVPSSTSAAIGIYEFAGKTMMVMLFGMTAGQALAVAVVAHATLVGFGVVGGLAGLVAAQVSISRVRRGVDQLRRKQGDTGAQDGPHTHR